MAAVSVPDTKLNSYVDVGWATPVNGKLLAEAFTKVIGKPFKAKVVMPSFLFVLLSFFALFVHRLKNMVEMVKWVNTDVSVSKDSGKQKRLFGDLPTIEETVARSCRDRNYISE